MVHHNIMDLDILLWIYNYIQC